MIQLRSRLKVADNSGAHVLSVIQIYGGSKRKVGSVGDVVKAVVKKADPLGQIREHEMVQAVIVRTKKEIRRQDGSYIRFDDNAAVVIDNMKDKNPRATRIFGPIARELRELGYNKIVSLAKEMY